MSGLLAWWRRVTGTEYDLSLRLRRLGHTESCVAHEGMSYPCTCGKGWSKNAE
jgi:hypothetical protein